MLRMTDGSARKPPLTPALSPQAGRARNPRGEPKPAGLTRGGKAGGGQGRVGTAALYRLLAWLSPGFPIGAFSYSHGLEAAVAGGAVKDRASLQGWIGAIVAQGSGRMDADILRDAHRATIADDVEALRAVNRRGLAFRATAELALETTAQGEAFLATCRAAWPDPFLELWAEAGVGSPHPPIADATGPTLSRTAGEGADARATTRGEAGEGKCHPAAFGAATARAGIALGDSLVGYLQAMAANLVSAGLRLAIIGQTDGQRILAALEPVIAEAAAQAISRDKADFGSATFAADLASMTHETQYSRLFRS
jgi:urease accessory protein